ncbi:MAG: SDR family NAD(P)-dependent oxidoreductase [Tannerella sp.]|jgi:short-subunit dehydrogenase|nr:SDR family NAD(P)-dependent oxidoreductase [Tannerella sp.]
MKKAIIIGATSGIGKEVALCLLRKGWSVGLAGRRQALLEEIENQFPETARSCVLDITQNDAVEKLQFLINQLDGMDLYFHSTGIGKNNPELESDPEIATVETNAKGFVRMVTAVYHYFSEKKGGHIAVISSIAGTKGIGVAPAYSATKRFQNIYIEALEQLSHINRLNINFTDIRPGFVKTDILDSKHSYPMLMNPEKVARQAVRAIERKKRIIVMDWRYRMLAFCWRLIPGWIWIRLKIRN